jgi:hypothetical protein
MIFTGNRPSMWLNIQNTSPFQKHLQNAQYTLHLYIMNSTRYFLLHNTIQPTEIKCVVCSTWRSKNMGTVFMQECCLSCCDDRLCTARLFQNKTEIKRSTKTTATWTDCAMMPASIVLLLFPHCPCPPPHHCPILAFFHSCPSSYSSHVQCATVAPCSSFQNYILGFGVSKLRYIFSDHVLGYGCQRGTWSCWDFFVYICQ